VIPYTYGNVLTSLTLVRGRIYCAVMCSAGGHLFLWQQCPSSQAGGEVLAAQAERHRPWLRSLRATLRAPAALLGTLGGHSSGLTALVVLPDGRLVSASGDKTIRVWNVEQSRAEMTLTGHDGAVWALALLADGRLASGSGGDSLDLWKNLDRPERHSAQFNEIRIWNLASGHTEAILSGHSDNVWALVPLSDGRLASGSRDGTIRVWNLATGKEELQFKEFVSALALASDSAV
jgi:WD40 repeat protein